MKRTWIWQELREALVEQLKNHHYSVGGLGQYRTVLNEIERFLQKRGTNHYSEKIGAEFQKDIEKHPRLGTVSTRKIPTVIRRLDDFSEGKGYIYCKLFVENGAPKCFTGLLDNYLVNLKLQGKRESTIKQYRHYATQFLNFLHISGKREILDIRPKEIYDAFMENTDKPNFSGALRSFLRYLHNSGSVAVDMAPFVPAMRRPEHIPSVYTEEETTKLLSCVNRQVRPGKRDYAMILIALRLGLRTGDVAQLTFDNIDFKEKMIHIVQEKTEIPLRIKLIPEVEFALSSYLGGERPESTSPYIFLLSAAPFTPVTRGCVYSAINRHFIKSGINFNGRKRGGHALRMTLASELISEDVPYDAVRKILGQEDPNSTKRYIKFDVSSLRRCALEVPPLSGTIANRLAGAEGGVR